MCLCQLEVQGHFANNWFCKKMSVAVISRNCHNNRQQSIPSYCKFKHFRENLIFANNAIRHFARSIIRDWSMIYLDQ